MVFGPLVICKWYILQKQRLLAAVSKAFWPKFVPAVHESRISTPFPPGRCGQCYRVWHGNEAEPQNSHRQYKQYDVQIYIDSNQWQYIYVYNDIWIYYMYTMYTHVYFSLYIVNANKCRYSLQPARAQNPFQRLQRFQTCQLTSFAQDTVISSHQNGLLDAVRCWTLPAGQA